MGLRVEEVVDPPMQVGDLELVLLGDFDVVFREHDHQPQVVGGFLVLGVQIGGERVLQRVLEFSDSLMSRKQRLRQFVVQLFEKRCQLRSKARFDFQVLQQVEFRRFANNRIPAFGQGMRCLDQTLLQRAERCRGSGKELRNDNRMHRK